MSFAHDTAVQHIVIQYTVLSYSSCRYILILYYKYAVRVRTVWLPSCCSTVVVCLSVCEYLCSTRYVVTKLHIPAQSGPVILVIISPRVCACLLFNHVYLVTTAGCVADQLKCDINMCPIILYNLPRDSNLCLLKPLWQSLLQMSLI